MKPIPFNEDIILENDVVLLRPLIQEDLKHLIQFAINEPTLWQYSLLDAGNEENMKQYLNMALEKRSENNSYPFIVYDKVQSKYAGSTRFYDYQQTHNTVQLGFTWYGKDFQGTHVNKNCKFLLLEYAFERLGIERVEFRADYNNKQSIAAMKSIGCIEEGILRSNCAAHDAGRRDSIILSILKGEWFDDKRANLLKKISML
jgi:RimJ/RimL family protein N-acetyltransferase